MASRNLRLALTALALAFACDTGFAITTTIIVPRDVAAAYTKESPGLLVVSYTPEGFDATTRPLAMICGDAFTSPEIDLGGDGERPDTTIIAWIEPTTAGRPCGPLANTYPDEAEHVLDEDAPWANTKVEAASGCGHDPASAELTLSAP